jgi:hypothetical protein
MYKNINPHLSEGASTPPLSLFVESWYANEGV